LPGGKNKSVYNEWVENCANHYTQLIASEKYELQNISTLVSTHTHTDEVNNAIIMQK